MKLPNSTEMSKEQKDIYLNAPLNGNILISGPPGTGKTVIAFLRAQTLASKKKSVSVIMFNNVLTSYTRNAAEEKFQVITFHKWLHEWWNNLNIGPENWQPEIFGKKVFLPRCSGYTRKIMDETFDGLWVRFDFNNKKWFTTPKLYNENKKFKDYARPVEIMPKADEFTPLWDEIVELLVQHKEKILENKSAHWGHLIIDEAQDFSKKMFDSFYMIQEVLFKGIGEKPALTIFADENQRIREENSTLTDIVDDLRIKGDQQYKLTKNYRNTQEIASVAATFYVGLKTGIPLLPQKKGEKPKLVKFKSFKSSIDYINRYLENHDNEEFGIFVQNHSLRQKFIQALEEKFKKTTNIKIQSYYSRDANHKDAKKMVFDKGGIVTVITKDHCKGLEFDTVFIPELQEVSIDPSKIEQFKMEMYVMTSRARKNLFLMYTNEGNVEPEVLKYLPKKEQNLLELTYE